ncbi:MAG: hypothetical protein PHV34_21670 [Verrucomicrobiae bacterium]|nr:hypothetical protein [Verrucomicrobiae bacterium]
MRAFLIRIFFLAAVVLILAEAQGESFPLVYRKAEGQGADIVQKASLGTSHMRAGTPPALKGLPPGTEERAVFFSMAYRRQLVVMALIQPTEREPARLWVDTRGQWDFRDQTPVEGVWQGKPWEPGQLGVAYFGPLSFKDGSDADPASRFTARVYFLPESNQQPSLQVYPEGFFEGTIRAGDCSFKTAVLPSSSSKFMFRPAGAVLSAKDEGQSYLLFVDLNQDGRFDSHSEMAPLSKILGIQEKFYKTSVAPDQSSIDLEPVQPDCGSIDLRDPDLELTVVSQDCSAFLTRREGPLRLPAGDYAILSHQLKRQDGNKTFLLCGEAMWRDSKRIKMETDQTVRLAMGAPLELKATAIRVPGGQCSIGFQIIGQGGEKYTAGLEENGSRHPAPEFTLLDESGRTLQTGNFEYG